MRAISDDEEIRTTVGLLQRYQLGEEEAFTQLYALHQMSLRRTIAARLGCRLRHLVDVEDVLQETYLAVWQFVDRGRFECFQSVGGFRNLLAKIATQKLLDQAKAHTSMRRDRRRTVPLEEAPHEPLSPDGRPSDVAQEHEMDELVEAAMLRLSAPDRWILDARGNIAMTYDAIAVELGCKPANAKLRYFRAKERLAKQLERSNG